MFYLQLSQAIDQLNKTIKNNVQQLDSSINMLHHQLSQEIENESQQLNSSINMLHHQLSQEIENESQQLNSSINMFHHQLSQEIENENQRLNSSINTINQKYLALEGNTQQLINVLQSTGKLQSYPAASCAAVLLCVPSTPSGHYWVRSSNGSAVHVYCDMTRSCGNITGGWTRAAELDMVNSSTQCPSGLRQRTDSNIRTCTRNSNSGGCSSVTLFTSNIQFSRVCGKIKAYQFGSTDAFGTGPDNIDSYYVDGISLTHGRPRQHIWTFASALDESTSSYPHTKCPCTNIHTANRATPPPAFVGNDYFCDTGSSSRYANIFYSDDPLWDGAGCGPQSTCCSLNNPPWFYKQLPQPTTDDIEMRVCRNEAKSNEDISIEMFDIYIQ